MGISEEAAKEPKPLESLDRLLDDFKAAESAWTIAYQEREAPEESPFGEGDRAGSPAQKEALGS